jgi:hypothetical protein
MRFAASHRNHRLAMLLAGLILFAVPGQADATEQIDLLVERPGVGPFSDDDGSVFEDDIVALWAAGIVEGCMPGSFCPDVAISRGQMAAMLRRARPDFFPGAHSPFADTFDSAFSDDVAALAAAGVTSGCTDQLFCPDDPVTRETMAAFLHRTFADLIPQHLEASSFRDLSESQFAAEISWLAGTGLTSGCSVGLFCPHTPVTRGQMAAFLRRALDLPSVEAPPPVIVDLAVPSGPGVEGWRMLVEHFFRPADVDRAIRVIACESKGDPDARNPHSSASGLFQHLASLWTPRAEAVGYPGASVFDPVANVAAAAGLVYEGGGWSHWDASRGCWS